MPWRLARVRTPERMDSASLATEEHRRALRGLARLNVAARSASILWPAVRRVALEARRAGGQRPVRALDVATGSGDIPVALAGRATRAGLDIQWHALDASARALDAAGERARRAGATLRIYVGNAVEPLPGRFDAVVCSLFLHHLDPPGAIRALRAMADAADRTLLVSDLRRTRLGLALAWTASRVLTRSDVVRFDAVASVRAAYTMAELRRMAETAGLVGAVVRRAWPQRMLLTWERRG